MNTGLLLKKPGESPYARYRRFIIANHGFHKCDVNLRKTLLETNINTEAIGLRDGFLYTSDIAVKFEREMILSNNLNIALPIGQISRNFKPFQHCQKCTEIGYHSNLFELRWISECPLHKILLVKACARCGQELPTSGSLLSRSCLSCGCKLNIKELIERFKRVKDKGYQIFSVLEPIIQVDTNLYPSTNFLNRQKQCMLRERCNENSSFYPSVILEIIHAPLSFNEFNGLFGIGQYEISTKKYKISDKKKSVPTHQADQLLSKEVILNITKRIISKLSDELMDHQVGECLTNDFPVKSICSSCKTYLMWRKIIPFHILDDINDHEFRFYLDNIMNLMRKLLYRPEVDFPETVYYMSSQHEKGRTFRMPISMTKKIYELDLWSAFLHIYHFIHTTDLAKSCGSETVDDFNKFLNPISKAISVTFCPLYIRKSDGFLIMKYPKILEQNNLNSHKLMLLSL